MATFFYWEESSDGIVEYPIECFECFSEYLVANYFGAGNTQVGLDERKIGRHI